MRCALIVSGSLTNEDVFGVRSARRVHDALQQRGWAVEMLHASSGEEIASRLITRPPDLVLPVGFGPPCEDGHIHALARLVGIPCSGPTPASGGLMQDKAVFGALVRATFAEDPQVRSPAECIVTRARSAVDQWEAIERLKRPLLVKSAWAGSSEHLHLFDEADEAVAVADALTAAEGKVLVQSLERAQKEVSCTVLDSPTGPIFLPVVELMRGSAAVMGKDEKFGDDARSRHLVSPTLAQELQEKLREVVFRLHEAVGATGLTRTDILILPNDELVVLEMNGIPGLLDSSIACDAAAAAGISFPQLCEAYADSAFIPRAEPDVWLGKIRRSRPPQL